MSTWIRIALRRDIVQRSLRVSLIVGSVLVLINQGDVLFAGGPDSKEIMKIVLTYVVPYLVSTYAGVEAIRNGL